VSKITTATKIQKTNKQKNRAKWTGGMAQVVE
jgi:hypothetical protein